MYPILFISFDIGRPCVGAQRIQGNQNPTSIQYVREHSPACTPSPERHGYYLGRKANPEVTVILSRIALYDVYHLYDLYHLDRSGKTDS